MLDIKFIRENKAYIQAGAKKKHVDFDVEELLKVDDERRAVLEIVERMRAEQNNYTEKIAKSSDELDRNKFIAEMKVLKEKIQKAEEDLKQIMRNWKLLMVRTPNIPDISVPEGKDDADNVEHSVWGEKPQFDFEPKDHIELMQNLDMLDLKRGVKVSGFRGYFLKNEAVQLCLAIWQFTLEKMIAKGWTPIMTQSLVKKEPFIGTGYLPQSEEDLYKVDEEMYLSGTSEVPMMGLYMDEVIDKKDFPLKYVAFSPCFRKEAGSHGKDTKGLVRVHEFFKVEQVVLCEADHSKSVELHEEIRQNAEDIMQALNIPYHIVVNCGGDLGLGQVKKYDLEAWVPNQNKYRETHSASYFHDFQTRRLNIKYRDDDPNSEGGQGGKLKFAHSLNSTAIPTPRVLVPLIENNQQADGSIKIPEVLQKYIGKDIITKKSCENSDHKN
ncbi:MAG: serine--tRNA ligase [Patescibacteria group bacterium]